MRLKDAQLPQPFTRDAGEALKFGISVNQLMLLKCWNAFAAKRAGCPETKVCSESKKAADATTASAIGMSAGAAFESTMPGCGVTLA